MVAAMPSGSANNVYNGTLTGNQVDTITMAGASVDAEILVENYGTANTLWVRCDGVNPVAGAHECTRVAPGMGVPVTPYGADRKGPIEVRVIADGAGGNTYSVRLGYA